jgi:hypothetical protein
VIGSFYLISSKIAPYHEKFLGMSHEQLDPKVATLLLSSIKGSGAAMVSIGVALAMLVKGPFSKGDSWTWWIILFMTLLSLIPLQFITLNIGKDSPWWLVSIMIILVVVSLAISRSECKNK